MSRKMKRKLINLIILLIILVISWYLDNYNGIKNKNVNKKVVVTTTNTLKVYYLDVGQADCTLLSDNGHYMLIDAGNDSDGYKLVRYFKSLGIETFDYVIATHGHEDHIGGMDKIIKKYDTVCDEIGIDHLCHHVKDMDSSNHLYLIRLPGVDVNKRNEFIEKMAQDGIATNVHYKPLPMMTAYKARGWNIKDFPNTFDYYKNLVTLPLHTLLTDEDVEFVCTTLKNIFEK